MPSTPSAKWTYKRGPARRLPVGPLRIRLCQTSSVPLQVLEGDDVELTLARGADGLDHRLGARERRDVGDAIADSDLAQRVEVAARVVAARGVDDELDVATRDHRADVRAHLARAADGLALDAGGTQGLGGTGGAHEREAHAHQVTSDTDDGALVTVAHGDEHAALRRQAVADGQLGLRVGGH